jgi:hypothetical protein
MPRLLINTGEATAHPIELKPGSNFIGRDSDNDIPIEDPSISARHCEIVVDEFQVRVRDLDSTNGTCIDGQRVQDAPLRGDQVLHVGQVEMRLEVPLAPRLPPSPVPATSPPGSGADAAAPIDCQHHPGTPAALRCNQCGSVLCYACTREIRQSGKVMRFCPDCRGMCLLLAERGKSSDPAAGFLARLPRAFVFPFRGDGSIALIAGTIFFAAVGFLGAFSLILSMAVSGYLAAFMQKIIATSAHGDDVLPSWPDFSELWADIVLPLLQVLGTFLICFGPSLFCRPFLPPEWKWLAVLFFLFGCFYFPMALLAVTMKGTLEAINPVFVIGSILRIPLDYLMACGVMALAFGAHTAGESLLPFLPFLLRSLTANFLALYFLIVEMAILGLLFRVNRERLGWFT